MADYGTVDDYMDQEYPGLVAEKFDKNVKKQFKKETVPVVKPKEVFVNFKNPKDSIASLKNPKDSKSGKKNKKKIKK
tara:strand:+ start:1434 stop:1664 length:231 start_codon:yes stop_codon:yes gene_type:complete